MIAAKTIWKYANVESGKRNDSSANSGTSACPNRSLLLRIDSGLPQRFPKNPVFAPKMWIGSPNPILKPTSTQRINTIAKATNAIIIEFTDQRFCITPP